MIKVLVADYHPIVSTGLNLFFDSDDDITVIGSVRTGTELVNFTSRNQVDIVLCEIDLPELNGITALRVLKEKLSTIKIIIFSHHPKQIYAPSIIKAGASGYLSKTANTQTIRNTIISVHKRDGYRNKQRAPQTIFDQQSPQHLKVDKNLSAREVEVLKLLCSGNRNKNIALKLNINQKTVSTYKTRLMRKLQVTTLVDLINQARHMEFNSLH